MSINGVILKNKYNQTTSDLVRWSCVAMALFIPISVSLTTVTVILASIGLLLSFKVQRFKQGISHPVSLAIIAFLVVYFLGCTYSSAPQAHILFAMKKMSRLLLIPLLLPYLVEEKWKSRVTQAFLFALAVSLLIVLLKKTGVVNYDLFYPDIQLAFKDSIFTSLFFAYGIFVLANLYMSSPKHRLINFIGLLLFITYLMFFCIGRTGQVILISLLASLIFFYGKSNLKLLAQVLLLSLAVIVAAVLISTSDFHRRMDAAHNEAVEHLSPNQEVKLSKTSVGIRLEMYKNTLQVAKEKPLLGWGVGSFFTVYNDFMLKKYGLADSKINPHNQYVLVLMETGIVGLFFMLLMFGTIFVVSIRDRASLYSKLCIGTLVAIAVGSLANSWLLDFASMHFFVLFTAALLPACAKKKASSEKLKLDKK